MTTDEMAEMVVSEVRDFVLRHNATTRTELLDEVKRLLSELPVQKGDPGEPGATGEPGPAGKDGADGAPGLDGKDGVDGKDGRDGNDGEPGPVGGDGPTGLPGAPGEKGMDGRDGRDGKDGIHGRDGIATTDELMALVSAEVEKRLEAEVARQVEIAVKLIPRIEYRDVWRPESEYTRGNVVTFGGSAWICKSELTTEKPEISPDWKLFVKRGRDASKGVRI